MTLMKALVYQGRASKVLEECPIPELKAPTGKCEYCRRSTYSPLQNDCAHSLKVIIDG